MPVAVPDYLAVLRSLCLLWRMLQYSSRPVWLTVSIIFISDTDVAPVCQSIFFLFLKKEESTGELECSR